MSMYGSGLERITHLMRDTDATPIHNTRRREAKGLSHAEAVESAEKESLHATGVILTK